ncbi:hypothetical protein DFH29DRAFT_1015684 [Suillus ampliporus]|nr:hypothetical protein DFH29DRAFT_1015684 [Suillus ampliporus]
MRPFKENKAATIADRLKQYYRDITAILAVDSWHTLKGVTRTLHGIEEHEKDKERRESLQWINPVSCTEKHDASCRQRNATTGRWIFQADLYVDLNTSDCAFLWLNGQRYFSFAINYRLLTVETAGSRKTILASAVIDEIQGGAQVGRETLGYFYCDFRDEQTTIAAAVLRSLVVQLLRQSKDDQITKIRAPEQQDSNAKGDLIFLRKQGSNNLTESVPRPVLVIDALDECKDHRDLLGYLVTLAEDARLRLFVTGRIEPDIEDALHHLPTVSLKNEAEQMQEDIRVHITEQLKTQKRLSRLP